MSAPWAGSDRVSNEQKITRALVFQLSQQLCFPLVFVDVEASHKSATFASPSSK